MPHTQPLMPHQLPTTTECTTPTIMAFTDNPTSLLLIIVFSSVKPNLTPNMHTATTHTPTPTTTLTTTTTTTSTELLILTPPTIHMLINQDTSFKDAPDIT